MENIHIGMLAADDEVFRRKAVIKVLHLKGLIEDLQSENGDFVGEQLRVMTAMIPMQVKVFSMSNNVSIF